jgi:cysteine synthase
VPGKTILDLIGNTPLVPLRGMRRRGMARVLLKLESHNPTGSLKDRIVKFILEAAERDGTLRPQHTIIDASSGNTGIALGVVAAVKGYKVRIFMPETKSIERRRIMQVLGTEVVLTSGADQNSHIWACAETARDTERFFYLNQNGNQGNCDAHYHGTGREIVKQTRGRIDCFVAGAGTGGTLVGVARYLRDNQVPARVVSVEPDNAKSKIEGLLHFDGSFVPPIWDPSVIDEQRRVGDDVAFATARELARREGIFAGPSSGAILAVALDKARELGPGKTVVALVCDRGDRYLSTRLVGDLG